MKTLTTYELIEKIKLSNSTNEKERGMAINALAELHKQNGEEILEQCLIIARWLKIPVDNEKRFDFHQECCLKIFEALINGKFVCENHSETEQKDHFLRWTRSIIRNTGVEKFRKTKRCAVNLPNNEVAKRIYDALCENLPGITADEITEKELEMLDTSIDQAIENLKDKRAVYIMKRTWDYRTNQIPTVIINECMEKFDITKEYFLKIRNRTKVKIWEYIKSRFD